MRFLYTLLLVAFLSLSVFGFVGMVGSDMHHETNTCLGSLAQNGACPPPEHTVASALFHANALKVFSTTLPSSVFLFLLFAFVLFVLASTKAGGTYFGNVVVSSIRIRECIQARSTSLFHIHRLLSRFELSPSFA